MPVNTIKWGEWLLAPSCTVGRIRSSVRYEAISGLVCNNEGYVLQNPTKFPEIISLRLEDLSFADISYLKNLFYTLKGYPPSVFQATLEIGNNITYDSCALKSLRFQYDRVQTLNLVNPVVGRDIGIFGNAEITFIRELVY